MLDNEQEYFWAKNIRPDAHHDQDRNTATNYIMRYLKRAGLIVKTYHVDSGEGQWGNGCQKRMDKTVLSQDLVPFVKYSVNKKKRWELRDDVDKKKMLEIISQNYHGMKVVITERTALNSIYFNNYFGFPQYLHMYPIRHFHQLLSDDTHEHLSTNAITGQPIQNFLSRKKKHSDLETPKRAGKTVIAYHFITAPKNYENLMKYHFCPGSSDRCCKQQTLAHEKRYMRMEYALSSLKYVQNEDLDEEVDMADDYPIYDKCPPPSNFYNLMDHIVDKFVFVKRARTQNSTCSSTWSVVSDM